MRDVIKAINDYEKLKWTQKGISAFYDRDAQKIQNHSDDNSSAILDALRAGYAIGYKAGMKASRKDEA